MSHALHLQTQRGGLDLRIEDSPYDVALVRPEVQQAFVVLARDGIFRLREIEGDGAIFDHHGGVGTVEKVG